MKLKTKQVSLFFLGSPQPHHLMLAVSSMPQEEFLRWVALKTTDPPTPIYISLFLNEDVHPPYSVKQVPGYLK